MPARIRPAAVAIAAVLATALGLVSCGTSAPHQAAPSTEPPTTAGSTPTSTGATSSPASIAGKVTGPYAWTRAASPALAIGGGPSSTLSAVVAPAGSSPWMVAGTRLGAAGSSTATVWSSVDGGSWRATALTGPQVDSQASAATSWHDGTVIVGSVGRGEDSQATVWFASAPGAPYLQAAPGGLAAGGSTMTSISGGALGLFAAGSANGRVALWYSSNGQHWTRLDGAERVIAATDDAHVEALLAGPEGGVFAAGWARSGSSIVAAMWSSSDGLHWGSVGSARTAFAGPGDHLITGLAPFGTGLIAVGGSRTGNRWAPASWLSPNGISWSQPSASFGLDVRPQADGPEAIVRGLSAVATGAHSASLTAVGGGPTAQRMWTSTDGLHWTEVSLPRAAADSSAWQATVVAVAGSTVVLADADPGQPHLLVRRPKGWAEPSSNPAVFGAVQPVAQPVGLASAAAGLLLAVRVQHASQAIGSTSSSMQLLSSQDGTTWTPVPSRPTIPASRVEGLAAVPGGFLAVGATLVGARLRAAVWFSPDGRTWGPAVALDPGSLTASDQASGVCVDGSLLAVVGSVQTRTGAGARAWVSRNRRQWSVVTIGPHTAPGVSTALVGCTTHSSAASGSQRIDAFGLTSTEGSIPGPAFWSAAGSTLWTRDTASPFGAGLPAPALDEARSGTLALVATAGPDAAFLPAGLESAGGSSSLWRTTDSGESWQRLDTPGPPWSGTEAAEFDRVAWFGPTPVVAGAVDGRLAVWTAIASG